MRAYASRMAERHEEASPERLPPLMQELLEVVARRLGMHQGRRRLELLFENGKLRDWSTHAERQPAGALRAFDES
jgi:hypothetical protein